MGGKSPVADGKNLSRPLSSDEIALRLSISKRQLERLFVSDTGESLQKFYRKIRLRYGLWLLQNTDRLITEIGQDCGFSDTAHFSRVFRQAFEKNQPITGVRPTTLERDVRH